MSTVFVVLYVSSSILLNTWLFIKCFKRRIYKQKHIMLASTAVANIFQSSFTYGFKIALERGMLDTRTGCIMTEFCVCFFGLVGIYNFITLSIERTLHATNHPSVIAFSIRWKYISPLASWVYSIIWSILPLLGWGNYDELPLFTPMCVSISGRVSQLTTTYLICFFLFNFLCPFMLVIFLQIISHRSLKRNTKKMAVLFDKNVMSRRKKRQHRFNFMCFTMTIAFFLSWLPYTISIIYYMITNTTLFRGLEIVSQLSLDVSLLSYPLIYLYWYFKNALPIGRSFRFVSRYREQRVDKSKRIELDAIKLDTQLPSVWI